ncbi:MAG: adenylyltransferase/cytidyltransferase family protein, partial [Planctomycetes bacterium]|nr:adenylyltransferase/cytidyltransferase family protein [Planctomycetota bacterium]
MHNGRVHTVDELAEVCARLRAEGKTIAHCHGAFDLLHPGHIRHLQAARALADVLVVTVTEDRFIRKGPGRPVYNERIRAESLAELSSVSHVATSPWPTAVETIELLKPNLYVKGQDYRDKDNDRTGAILAEEQAVQRCGGKLVFTDEIQFSSTKLLNEFFSVLSEEQKDYLRSLQTEYSAADVLSWLDKLKTTRVLVIGEAIFDEYCYCIPDAMSNKTPTLSARFESEEVFAGGVVAVGNHLAGLAGQVNVLACAGKDNNDETVTLNQAAGVTTSTIVRPDAPTVRKRRFVHRILNQKLFEVTFLDDRPISPETEAEFIGQIDQLVPHVDVAIVLDFGHGFFTPAVVDRLRERAPFLAVNAQINSSNRGFNSIRKYNGADYISVDEYEIRLPFGDRYGALRDLIHRLSEETGCRRINVTLGSNGTVYYDGADFHQAPVVTNQSVDALGAGDAFLAATALLVHCGAPSALIPFVGNCMGGLMAQIIGHR